MRPTIVKRDLQRYLCMLRERARLERVRHIYIHNTRTWYMRPTIVKGDLQRYLCTRARRGKVRLELWRLRHKTSVWLICTCGMTQFKCVPWLIVMCSWDMTQFKYVPWFIFMCTCDMTQFKCVPWLIFMCSCDMTQFERMSYDSFTWNLGILVKYMNESCHTYECVPAYTWLSHFTSFCVLKVGWRAANVVDSTAHGVSRTHWVTESSIRYELAHVLRTTCANVVYSAAHVVEGEFVTYKRLSYSMSSWHINEQMWWIWW